MNEQTKEILVPIFEIHVGGHLHEMKGTAGYFDLDQEVDGYALRNTLATITNMMDNGYVITEFEVKKLDDLHISRDGFPDEDVGMFEKYSTTA